MNIDWVVDCLTPWCVLLENSIDNRYLESGDKYFSKHNLNGLLRGDTAARGAFYAIGRQWGWLSANDIRRKEDEALIPGGDVYLSPLNMQNPAKPDPNQSQDDTTDDNPSQDDPPPAKKKKAIDQLLPFVDDLVARIANKEEKAFTNIIRKAAATETTANKNEVILEAIRQYYVKETGNLTENIKPLLKASNSMANVAVVVKELSDAAISQLEVTGVKVSTRDWNNLRRQLAKNILLSFIKG